MPFYGICLCIFTAILWAASPLFMDRGMRASGCTQNEVNPIRSVAAFTGTCIVLLIIKGGHPTPVHNNTIYLYALASVCCGYLFGDMLYIAAIKAAGVGIAAPVASSYPVLVILTSFLILREPITFQLIAGISLTIIGLIVLRFFSKKSESDDVIRDKKSIAKGFLLALIAGMLWAISSPLVKLSIKEGGLDAIDITFYRLMFFVPVSLMLRFLTVKFKPQTTMPITKLNRKAILCFIASGMIGICISSLTYSYCFTIMPVAPVVAIAATNPFIAALFSHFVFKERLSHMQWIGIIMIIAGSITVAL